MAMVTFDKMRDIRIVRFCFNEINLQQRSEIKGKLIELLDQGDRRFVFNFSKTGFFSSLIIATILFFVKESRDRNGDVKICSLSPEAGVVFKLTKMDKIVELYDTEEDAVTSYAGGCSRGPQKP